MRRCPKFNSCSAPICPLDKDWKSRVKGGDICPYLRYINRLKPPPQIAKIVFSHLNNGSSKHPKKSTE